MTTQSTSTVLRNVALTAEEASELLRLVETSLGETRVEVHHTHTPDFRDKVLHREAVLNSLADKLGRQHA